MDISQTSWYYWGGYWPGFDEKLPLVSTTVEVDGGFYEGAIDLPNLEQGSYEVQIKVGDVVVSRQHITVEKYSKPDYKMDVTKDKEAIFVGDTVNFTLNTSFFEGTPVTDLPVSYNLYGMDYLDGSEKTDEEGLVRVSYTPKYQSNYQDQVYGGFSAYAVLPESGELYGYEEVRIFVNDINVAIDTELEGDEAIINATVHSITLDRLNNHSAEDDSDYLDQVVSGHSIEGLVYRNEWIKTEVGETYDFINKVVRKKYDYHMDTQVYDQVTLVTGDDGLASVNLTLPKEDSVHYTLEVTTKDLSGRSMSYNHYFSDYDFYHNENDRIRLLSDKEVYEVDELVSLTMNENDQVLDSEQYMYIVAQNGVRDVFYSDQAMIEIPYEEAYMPNIEMFSVAFTGNGYKVSESLYINGDYQDKTIDLEMTTDAKTYKPGDEITVDIKASHRDSNGLTKPVNDGVVNISLVDEALLALSDQSADTLETLYHHVDGGILMRKASHNNGGHDSQPFYGGFRAEDEMVMTMAVGGKEAMKMDMAESTMLHQKVPMWQSDLNLRTQQCSCLST